MKTETIGIGTEYGIPEVIPYISYVHPLMTDLKKDGVIQSERDTVIFYHKPTWCDLYAVITATFNGKNGGTKNTINYTNRIGVYVYNVLNI